MNLGICEIVTDGQLLKLYLALRQLDEMQCDEHYDMKNSLKDEVHQLLKDEIETRGCDKDHEILMVIVEFCDYDFENDWKGTLLQIYKNENKEYRLIASNYLEFLKVSKNILSIAAVEFYYANVTDDSKYYVSPTQLENYLRQKRII